MAPRLQPPVADVLLAVGAATVATAETLSGNHDGGSVPVYVVSGLLQTLPLAWRRRAPLGVLLWVLGVVVVEALLTVPGEGIGTFFGVLVPVYTAAAHRPLRPAVVALLLPVPALAFTSWRLTGRPFEDVEFATGLIAALWVAGRVVWSRQQLVDQLAAQAEELRRGRAAEARAAAADERARIARDLHDVVAHSISVMVVQAEAGEALLDDRERAAAALRAVQRTGRDALTDLRRLLGVLRPDSDPGAGPLEPTPGLADVDALLARVRSAGVDVAFRVEGEPRELPPSVQLAAYRVLQEALTNVVRHAGPSRARAVLRYADGAVSVDVTDTGPAQRRRPPTAPSEPGRGLLGMRERVGAFGGEVRTGPDGPGFRVVARIPVEAG